jgi:membrane-bound serine protease (ClpP class)
MKKRSYLFHFSIIASLLGLILLLAPPPVSGRGANKVYSIQLDGDSINPVTSEYIVGAIDKATRDKAECLIIKLDTPGGLLSSTRSIVKSMLTSKVPLVVYISPSGSRAGSAGVFITYASHVAAMAPSTNIGAAHPVTYGQSPKNNREWEDLKEIIQEIREQTQKLSDQQESEQAQSESENETDETDATTGRAESDTAEKPAAPPGTAETTDTAGEAEQTTPTDAEPEPPQAAEADKYEDLEPDDDAMGSKVLQDTVAFIRAIAQARNRNVQWAVKSVTKSVSITDEEALEQGVVEIIAKNDRELLKQLDGRVVVIDGQERPLQTASAAIVDVSMTLRQKFFNVLADPNIAYILLILGFFGLLFEVTHPGFGLPGILGTIFLILAFYSLQTLPTNYAGLALILVGIIFLIAEAYVPGFGLFTISGIVSLVIGSFLLFDAGDPTMRVSKSIIFAFTLAFSGITIFVLHTFVKTYRAKKTTGQEGMVGEEGTAASKLEPGKKGKVFVHGEYWNAISDEQIDQDEEIVVESVKGLTVKVKKRIS